VCFHKLSLSTPTPACISAAIRATVALPVPTSRAVFRMPVRATKEARTAASRFCDQLRAPKGGWKRSAAVAAQKLMLDHNIPTVIDRHLAKYKKIGNHLKVITSLSTKSLGDTFLTISA
jgi:hypothetical protein